MKMMFRVLSMIVIFAFPVCAEEVQVYDDIAIAKVFPSLVRIEVASLEFYQGKEAKVMGIGSGAIISEDGYIVTNHHVAGRAVQIKCILTNGKEIKAKKIGTDALTDLCVLKMELASGEKMPFAVLGDSSKVRVGDVVFAMGNPNAISSSVTKGIVSNPSMIMPAMMGGEFMLEGEPVGSIVKWIAHDSVIFPGNSGGPLVNVSGEIIGINEISFGLGGAIPSNLAKKVIEAIISFGYVKRSWLGIDTQPLLKASKQKKGVLVSGVVFDSPAQKAGIKPNDIIVSINGIQVSVIFQEDMPKFQSIIYDLPVGGSIEIEISRNNELKKIKINTIPREKARSDEFEIKEWGISAMNLTKLCAVISGRKTTEGVFLTGVRPGGACGQSKFPLVSGDIIIEIEGKKIGNIDDLKRLTSELMKDKDKEVPALVRFERRKEKYLTVVKLKREKDEEAPEREARKAWTEVLSQILTPDLAEKMGIKGKKGIILTYIYKSSEAERAGFLEGDIITHINGDEVESSTIYDKDIFPNMLRRCKINEKAEFTVIRNNQEIKISAVLAETPISRREVKKVINRDFGFEVRELTYAEKKGGESLENKEAKGCMIESVEPGSLAAISGLSIGDVMISLNGEETPDVNEYKKVIEKVYNEKPDYLIFFVSRGIGTTFIEMEIDWSKVERR